MLSEASHYYAYYLIRICCSKAWKAWNAALNGIAGAEEDALSSDDEKGLELEVIAVRGSAYGITVSR